MTTAMGQFGRVPRALMDHPGRNASHIASYAALSSCLPFDGRPERVPFVRLHDRTGLSEKQIGRLLTDLEAWGFLIVTRRRGTANRYQLVDIDGSGQATLPLEGLPPAKPQPQPRTFPTVVASNGQGHPRPKVRTSATQSEDITTGTLQSFQKHSEGISEEDQEPAPPFPTSGWAARFDPNAWGTNERTAEPTPLSLVTDEILEHLEADA